jgi:protein-arginine kinase activator protein McsA
MIRRRQKTVITVETFQRTTVRSRRKAKFAWCEQCAAETAMLAPDEAAAFLQTTARQIFRLTEAGEVHFLETESGALLVCRNSCQNHLRQRAGQEK